MNAPQTISAEAIASIVASISPGADTRRHGLLAEVLTSWSENDLCEYVKYAEKSKERPGSKKLLDDIHETATVLEKLMQKAIATGDIEYLDLILKTPRDDKTVSDLMKAVGLIRDASGKAAGSLARGRGQPQNGTAYLVIRDIAGIYEWLYPKRATRVVYVDDGDHKETGPFWSFASSIWCKVFGPANLANGKFVDDGLSSAVRAFTAEKNKSHRASPVVHNTLTRILHDPKNLISDEKYSAKGGE